MMDGFSTSQLAEEYRETERSILDTISKNGYKVFPDALKIFDYGKDDELNRKYLCYTSNVPDILDLPKKEIAIVSGVGATNPPTMGTMSELLKIVDIQQKTGLYIHFIINDLGSINARKINVDKVLKLTVQYKAFLKKLGFDGRKGKIVTHDDLDHARIATLVSRCLSLSDFDGNTEATDQTYDRLGLRGNDFSVMLDHIFTASDVLYPIIKNKKRGVIVVCGLDEFYHANIGEKALTEMMNDESFRKLLPDDFKIGAIYGKIVKGLYPYYKQSKSIPESSVNLGQSVKVIQEIIMGGSDSNDGIVLEMMQLASSWDKKKIREAERAFECNRKKWLELKKEYCEQVIGFKKTWDGCAPKTDITIESLF